MKKIDYTKKPYASAPVGLVSAELTKNHKPTSLNRAKKIIESTAVKLKCGEVKFSEEHRELSPYALETDLELISQFHSIKLSRIEFQIYLAIFDLFLSNYNKTKNNEEPIFMSIKDFHNGVMGISNRIRKEDIQRYIDIFDRLSMKIITIESRSTKKRKRLFIHGPIANITNIFIPEENFYGVKIFPTGFIQYECQNKGYITNFLPREFIQLDMRENDNVLFFGYFLIRMHNTNKRKGKLTSDWKSCLFKLINKSLPDPELFIANYENNKYQKSQFITRHILNPLKKSLEILKNKNYILEYQLVEINTKKFFSGEPKLILIFNYDKENLLTN